MERCLNCYITIILIVLIFQIFEPSAASFYRRRGILNTAAKGACACGIGLPYSVTKNVAVLQGGRTKIGQGEGELFGPEKGL